MANPDRQGQSDYRRTEQEVANSGFDETFQVPTAEILAYNSSTNTLDRVQINSSGQLLTSASGGGGSGGTSSNFGSADPTAGTAAGFSDGTNMREARVFDADTGAGTQYVVGATLRKSASGGSVEAGTSSDPLRTDPTGTTAQPITDNGGSLTVDNGGTFAVQATVAAGATNVAKAEDVASADADVGIPAMAIRKATPANTSGTDGDYEMLQLSAGRLWVDASGKTLTVDGSGVTQPVSGTITANIGTTNGLALDATLTGGTQQTKLTDGSNAVGVLKSDGTAGSQNAIMSASAFLSVPFTTSTVQAVGSTDAGNYRYVSVHITTQGGSSTVTFQSSNDNTNWISTALNFSTSVATIPASSTTSAAVIYGGALTGRYFRLNVTGIASGTTAGTIVFSAQPTVPMVIGAQAAQTGTWTVGSNSATGSAVPANAFYTGGVNASGNLVGLATIDRPNDAATGTAVLAVGGYIYNGTTFDRTRSIINATNSTGTGIQASGLVGQFDDVSPTAITENQFGNVRMSANRNLYNTIRDAAGNERGVNVTAQNAAVVEGSTASGSSLVGSPVTTGGLAKTANPTAVADGQVVNNLHDKLGKQVVVGSIRDLKGNQFTTITASTSETTVVTAVASTFLDVYGIIVENTSATASKVTFKDSTAGTTQFEIYVPAGDTRGFTLPESGAFKQTTVNNNWTATCGTSVSSIVISVLFVKNL